MKGEGRERLVPEAAVAPALLCLLVLYVPLLDL